MSAYEIVFTIKKAGAEIGFGAVVASTVEAAAYGVDSLIQNREWETEPGMPDPSEVDK